MLYLPEYLAQYLVHGRYVCKCVNGQMAGLGVGVSVLAGGAFPLPHEDRKMISESDSARGRTRHASGHPEDTLFPPCLDKYHSPSLLALPARFLLLLFLPSYLLS